MINHCSDYLFDIDIPGGKHPGIGNKSIPGKISRSGNIIAGIRYHIQPGFFENTE